MSSEKTPTHRTLYSFWESVRGKKRGAPSTGSSTEGTVSKAQRTDSVDLEDMASAGLKKDLLEDFESDLMDTATTEHVVDGFEKHMETCFQQFRDQIRSSLKKVITAMNEKINTLTERLDNFIKEQRDKDSGAGSQELEKLKIELNRQAQYSRKDNLRMFGVAENEGEDCRQVVCDVIARKLDVHILPSDIAVAHRLPKSRKQTHPPIIIRFKERQVRWDILKVRKKLKGSGISIAEDMTQDNFKLMMDAQESGCFTSVWFSNGRVKASDRKKKTHTLNLFDDFKRMVG